MNDFPRTRLLQQPPPMGDDPDVPPTLGYAMSGKIMLSAIVILFAVVVFMVCLHVYARWYLIRARQRHLRRRNGRRTHLVFYAEPNNPNSSSNAARGLDAAVLSSLPARLYSAKTHTGVLECAVCLSEFEENDKIRVLPKCNHSFHMECVDMWFHSHSTCPLCRSPVEPVLETRDFVVSVSEPSATEPDLPCSSSGLCATCQQGGHCPPPPSSSSSSSLGDRRKAFELERVTIQVPRTNESQDEFGPSQVLKSPAASRLMSLKRILSMNRREVVAAVSPSAGVGTSRGVATSELDVECGRAESSTQ